MYLSLLFAASITLATPENGATYDTHSPCVKEFLDNWEKRGEKPPRPALTEEEIKQRDRMNERYAEWEKAGRPKDQKVKKWEDRFNYYMLNSWTKPLMERAAEEERTWKPFTWKADFTLNEAKVEFSETEDFANPIVEKVKAETKGKKVFGAEAIRPGYLKLGTKYWWRVSGEDESGAKVVSDVRTFTTENVPPRMIGKPSFNFRDMGGGVNADGVKVRQGLLYRGQAPMTKVSVDVLKSFYVDKLGIKTQVDLRGKDECENRQKTYGEVETSLAGIEHLFFPIIPYHVTHPSCAPNVREMFKVFSDKSKYPIYFNCAVGSDRTGTVAFILDGVIGREEKYFYDNYELPSFNHNLPRFRYCRKGSELFSTFGPKKEGETTRGNVIKYLLKIGVTQEEIDAVQKILLEK